MGLLDQRDPLDQLRSLVAAFAREAGNSDHTDQREPLGRAVRILEAIAVALHVRDGRALQRPDRWAREYLERQGPRQRFHGRAIVPRADAAEELCRVASLAIGPKTSRSRAGGVVYNESKTIAHMIAVTIQMLGLAEDNRLSAAEARFERALGDVTLLRSPEKVVRHALVAFDIVPDGRAASDWLRARRQKRLRARRRRNI